MSESIPQGALDVFCALLIFSVICLCPNLVLAVYFIRTPDRFSYVSLCTWFLAISTTSSIIQQIHFAVKWRSVKQATFEKSRLTDEFPGLRLIGAAHPVQLVNFKIQNTIYNVVGVLLFFWAAHLFIGMWKIRIPLSTAAKTNIRWACLAFAIIVPAIFQGILLTDRIKRSLLASLIIYNCLFVLSTSLGSILVMLTLYKYIRSRRELSRAGAWSGSTNYPRNNRSLSSGDRSRRKDEQWLIVRFTIGFCILMIFELCMVTYQIIQSRNVSTDQTTTTPDLSVPRTKTDLLAFFPGVTASLVFWLVFGTTAVLRREYVNAARKIRGKVCFWRRRGDRDRGRDGDGDGERGSWQVPPRPGDGGGYGHGHGHGPTSSQHVGRHAHTNGNGDFPSKSRYKSKSTPLTGNTGVSLDLVRSSDSERELTTFESRNGGGGGVPMGMGMGMGMEGGSPPLHIPLGLAFDGRVYGGEDGRGYGLGYGVGVGVGVGEGEFVEYDRYGERVVR
ncbi:hypothetical protein FQN52_003341 [Onygenales sp. PD_12]|nr:hypothetical protein FQN52_003341 [Onygenales sp. PD_12]